MKNTILRFGILSGIIMVILMCLTLPFADQMGHGYLSMLVGYTTMVLSLSMMFFAIESYKKRNGFQTLSFGQTFKIGIMISLMASLFYIIAWMIMSHFFMPDFMEKYYAHIIENMRQQGASEAEITKVAAEGKKYAELYKNPFIKVAMTFIEIFPVGLLMTLLASFIELLRSSKKKQQTAI